MEEQMEWIEQIKNTLQSNHSEWDIVVKIAAGVLHFKCTNKNDFIVRRSLTFNSLKEERVIKAIELLDNDLSIAKNLNKDGRYD